MDTKTVIKIDNEILKRLFFFMLICMSGIIFFIWEKGKFGKVEKTKLVGKWWVVDSVNFKLLVIKENLNKLQLVDDSLNLAMDIDFDGSEGFILLGASGEKIPFKYNKNNDELIIEGEGDFRRSVEQNNKR